MPITVREATIVLRIKGTLTPYSDVKEVADAIAEHLKFQFRRLSWRERIEVEEVDVADAFSQEVEVPTQLDLKEQLLEEGLID